MGKLILFTALLSFAASNSFAVDAPQFDEYDVAQQRMEPTLGLAQRTLRDLRTGRMTEEEWAEGLDHAMKAAASQHRESQLHIAYARYLSQELFEALQGTGDSVGGVYRRVDSAAQETLDQEHRDRAMVITLALASLRRHMHQYAVALEAQEVGQTPEEYGAKLEYRSMATSSATGRDLLMLGGGVFAPIAAGFGLGALTYNFLPLLHASSYLTEMAAPAAVVTFFVTLAGSSFGFLKTMAHLAYRKGLREFPAQRAAADARLSQEFNAIDLDLLRAFITGAMDRGVTAEVAITQLGITNPDIKRQLTCGGALSPLMAPIAVRVEVENEEAEPLQRVFDAAPGPRVSKK